MPTAYFSKLVKVQHGGTFYFMNSRNNNFSNRSQKGTITTSASSLSMSAQIGVGVGVGLDALVIIAAVIFGILIFTGRLTFKSFSSRV